MSHLEEKIIKASDIKTWAEREKQAGKRIVFTNGVFDILHKGHVNYLHKAAQLGDVLIIGLNDDDSVKRLNKGPERPINKELDRAYVLAGLASVAAIVLFNDDTPYELIKTVAPNVLVKGGDYDPNELDSSSKKYLVGSDIVRKTGGEVKVISFVDGYSTTSIVKKLK